MRQIVIDTETTGFSPEKGDRMVEIAAVEMIGGRLTGHCFQTYLNPQCDIHPKAQEVHGLSNEFLADKPLFTDVVIDLIRFIDVDVTIGHNFGFDVMFLRYEMGLLGYEFWDYTEDAIDTLKMARVLFPGKKCSLDILCERYGIDSKSRVLHGALIDARLTAEVYLAMDMKLPSKEMDVPAETRKGYDQSKHLVRPNLNTGG